MNSNEDRRCKLRESELKSAVEDYLQLGMNQGKWIFFRLNAGDFIEVRGNTRRRIKGCPKGTSDFGVIQSGYDGGAWVVFLELKSDKGKQSDAQKDFQRLVQVQECDYFIIRDMDRLFLILGEL